MFCWPFRAERHDLERRERAEPAVLDQVAAQQAPGWLDGQVQLADDVALLARRAQQERVGHLLVELVATLQHVLQERPLAARTARLPAAALVQRARVDAVAALGARVGVAGDVGGKALRGRLALHRFRRSTKQIGERAHHRFARRGHADDAADRAGAEDELAGIQDARSGRRGPWLSFSASMRSLPKIESARLRSSGRRCRRVRRDVRRRGSRSARSRSRRCSRSCARRAG